MANACTVLTKFVFGFIGLNMIAKSCLFEGLDHFIRMSEMYMERFQKGLCITMMQRAYISSIQYWRSEIYSLSTIETLKLPQTHFLYGLQATTNLSPL